MTIRHSEEFFSFKRNQPYHFGRALKSMRQEKKLTQVQVERMCNLRKAIVYKWEKAKYPPLWAIVFCCKIYGKPLWKFFAEIEHEYKVYYRNENNKVSS